MVTFPFGWWILWEPLPGTALGDPIEVGAQRAVYGKGAMELIDRVDLIYSIDGLILEEVHVQHCSTSSLMAN